MTLALPESGREENLEPGAVWWADWEHLYKCILAAGIFVSVQTFTNLQLCSKYGRTYLQLYYTRKNTGGQMSINLLKYKWLYLDTYP